MLQVHILVEGQTEGEFVREILNEYLHPKGIYLNAVIATTRRSTGGKPAHRGGVASYGKIEFDVKKLIRDSGASLVTTMIDFYRLPTDFPGFNDDEARKGAAGDSVRYLERKFAEAIASPKFLPYMSIHEFEALLFSDTDAIVREVKGEDQKTQQALQNIRGKYDNPEEINKDNPPSKRIIQYLGEYDKVVHGYLIAIEIGIDKMRQNCPHFHEWLSKIEALVI